MTVDVTRKLKEAQALLVTGQQAAQLCGVGERSSWRWSRSGRAPAPVRIGGSVRYRRTEIEAWISNGCPRCDGKAAQ